LTYGTGRTAEAKRREQEGRFYQGKSERARTGVLLLHSVGGTPRELGPVATGLSERGYTVSCCMLAGHGGSEEDLLASGWKDWFASAEQALAMLERQCDVIVVGGLSEGSILALRLAALHPARVNGLCLFAPTLKYNGWAVPWYSFLLMLGLRAPFLRRMRITDPPPYGIKDEATRALIAEARHADASHPPATRSTSLGTLQESHWLTRDVIRRLSTIKAPALIVHPREDDISDISNAIYLQRRLGGLVDFWVLDDSYHLITIDRQRDVVMTRTAEFIGFIERYSKKQFGAPRRAQAALVAGREFGSQPDGGRPEGSP
jgi:carboxylesterase